MKFNFKYFLNPETDNLDEFGSAVHIYNGRIAVGDARKEKLYIFKRQPFSSNYKLSQTINSLDPSSDPNNPKEFAYDIKFNENYIVGGQLGRKSKKNPEDNGRCWVWFYKNGKYEFLQELERKSDEIGGYFGGNISMNNQFIVVGASAEGRVYIYRFIKNKFVYFKTIESSIEVKNFGIKIELYDNILAIASTSTNTIEECAYHIYKFVGNDFILSQIISPPSPENTNLFGNKLSLNEGKLVISDSGFSDNEGRVYIYNYVLGKFKLNQVLEPPDKENKNISKGFGHHQVYIKDGFLIVGARFYFNNEGRTYIYVYSNGKYKLLQTLKTPEGIETPKKFGQMYSLDDGILAISSDDENNFHHPDTPSGGNVYIYHIGL